MMVVVCKNIIMNRKSNNYPFKKLVKKRKPATDAEINSAQELQVLYNLRYSLISSFHHQQIMFVR